ncbi:hypothetical protein BH10ACI1_BH10ACI1_26730 [soil metagenome]
MQEKMKNVKPMYCNICLFLIKLISLSIVCCLIFSCRQKVTKQVLSTQSQILSSESAININTASIKELEKLPQIGAKRAQDIVAFREKFGLFRKPEHLLLVHGISDRRFREIRDFIKTE